MKVLMILKKLINFTYFSFVPLAIFYLIFPLYSSSIIYESRSMFWLNIILPTVYLSVIFMIIFFLRKFVLNSFVNKPFDESARKYLKLSGIFCVVYGSLSLPQIFGYIVYYSTVGVDHVNSMVYNFLNFGTFHYSILIGLFFIYMSKILEVSDLMEQENQLTI